MAPYTYEKPQKLNNYTVATFLWQYQEDFFLQNHHISAEIASDCVCVMKYIKAFKFWIYYSSSLFNIDLILHMPRHLNKTFWIIKKCLLTISHDYKWWRCQSLSPILKSFFLELKKKAHDRILTEKRYN